MGFMDFLKKKKKEGAGEKREIDIPPAPPTKGELPSFPSAEEIKVDSEEIREKGPSVLEKAEKAAVKGTEEELEEREDLNLKKPIFVYLDAYKELMNETGAIASTLKEASDSLARVEEFKEDEDAEYKKWYDQIKDIQKKLTYADKTLFQSKI